MSEHAALARITIRGVAVEVSGSEEFVQKQINEAMLEIVRAAASAKASAAAQDDAQDDAKDRFDGLAEIEANLMATLSSVVKTKEEIIKHILNNVK